MRGMVFLGNRQVELRDFPDPVPGPGEVVIAMRASGMCGSDLKPYRHVAGDTSTRGVPMPTEPTIGGHEPCGVIEEMGPGVVGKGLRKGARVMVHHYAGCGTCPHCRGGWAQLCADVPPTVYGMTGHGGHAPYMKVPAFTLVHLPDALPFSTGAAISCGTGTAHAALVRIGCSGNDTIAVFGQGPVGLSATQLATEMGARVIALDISPTRLARATEFGAWATIDPSKDEPVAAIRDLTHGGATLSLETSSAPGARRAAIQCVRTWGTACYVGEGGDVTLEVSPDLLRRQVTIVASWTFSSGGQADCARFVEERGIDVEALFTHRWKLAQAKEAYQLFDRQADGKGVFLF